MCLRGTVIHVFDIAFRYFSNVSSLYGLLRSHIPFGVSLDRPKCCLIGVKGSGEGGREKGGAFLFPDTYVGNHTVRNGRLNVWDVRLLTRCREGFFPRNQLPLSTRHASWPIAKSESRRRPIVDRYDILWTSQSVCVNFRRVMLTVIEQKNIFGRRGGQRYCERTPWKWPGTNTFCITTQCTHWSLKRTSLENIVEEGTHIGTSKENGHREDIIGLCAGAFSQRWSFSMFFPKMTLNMCSDLDGLSDVHVRPQPQHRGSCCLRFTSMRRKESFSTALYSVPAIIENTL